MGIRGRESAKRKRRQEKNDMKKKQKKQSDKTRGNDQLDPSKLTECLLKFNPGFF